MKINKAIKVKVHPTAKQRKILSNHFGCARWVYNHFLQYKTEQYKLIGKSPNYNQMSGLLTELKKQPNRQWLNNISRKALNGSLENLDTAFKNFFTKKAGYPKFKNKYSKQSYRLDNQASHIHQDGVKLHCIGLLKCEPQLPEIYKLLSITVSKTVTDKYYASINIETEIPDPVINKNKPIVGIDFGLKTFITTSNGEKISHPQPFKGMQKKLRRAQRKLSRRKKGSKRREAQRRKVALIYERISNQRRDFLHKLSSKMVSENQAIYLEDLSLKGMQSRWGRKINDLSWRIFSNQLGYKGNWYGCLVDKIDRFWPSSKMCSECGFINSKLTLKDREWICPKCGKHHDRDENAAKNIKQYGTVSRNQWTGRVGVIEPLVELSRN